MRNKFILQLENDRLFNTNYITRKLFHYLIFHKSTVNICEIILKKLN